MIFEFGDYKIDVDVERTAEFYKNEKLVSEYCTCDACQNFAKAVDFLPAEVRDFFGKLGIEMAKVPECYVNYAKSKDTLYYGGFYHVCGKLISGHGAWVSVGENTSRFDDDLTYKITDDFHVSVEDQADLLSERFPRPVLQIEFLADIPWVLDIENDYYK